MIVNLFCPKCVHELTTGFTGHAEIEVPVPISRLSDDGIYDVICGKGHESLVILDNLKFELLFEMGLNALIDSYPREAVSSFTSSLERFYEFFWRVGMRHLSVNCDVTDKTWKIMANSSERQLGAYVTIATALKGESPSLLNPNKDVSLRNNVIHKGYVPTKQEAIKFGNVVMDLINKDLEFLRSNIQDSLTETYNLLSPSSMAEEIESNNESNEIIGTTNILTAVDVRCPARGDDNRVGDVEKQFARILKNRQPTRMQLLSENELKKREPVIFKKRLLVDDKKS